MQRLIAVQAVHNDETVEPFPLMDPQATSLKHDGKVVLVLVYDKLLDRNIALFDLVNERICGPEELAGKKDTTLYWPLPEAGYLEIDMTDPSTP